MDTTAAKRAVDGVIAARSVQRYSHLFRPVVSWHQSVTAQRRTWLRRREVPTSYAEAKQALDERGTDEGWISANTRVRYNPSDGTIELILHSTPIVTWRGDGTASLYAGGYQTVTTKTRMNQAGFPVFQRAHVWYYGDRDTPFEDGMIVGENGGPAYSAGEIPPPPAPEEEAVERYEMNAWVEVVDESHSWVGLKGIITSAGHPFYGVFFADTGRTQSFRHDQLQPTTPQPPPEEPLPELFVEAKLVGDPSQHTGTMKVLCQMRPKGMITKVSSEGIRVNFHGDRARLLGRGVLFSPDQLELLGQQQLYLPYEAGGEAEFFDYTRQFAQQYSAAAEALYDIIELGDYEGMDFSNNDYFDTDWDFIGQMAQDSFAEYVGDMTGNTHEGDYYFDNWWSDNKEEPEDEDRDVAVKQVVEELFAADLNDMSVGIVLDVAMEAYAGKLEAYEGEGIIKALMDRLGIRNRRILVDEAGDMIAPPEEQMPELFVEAATRTTLLEYVQRKIEGQPYYELYPMLLKAFGLTEDRLSRESLVGLVAEITGDEELNPEFIKNNPTKLAEAIGEFDTYNQLAESAQVTEKAENIVYERVLAEIQNGDRSEYETYLGEQLWEEYVEGEAESWAANELQEADWAVQSGFPGGYGGQSQTTRNIVRDNAKMFEYLLVMAEDPLGTVPWNPAPIISHLAERSSGLEKAYQDIGDIEPFASSFGEMVVKMIELQQALAEAPQPETPVYQEVLSPEQRPESYEETVQELQQEAQPPEGPLPPPDPFFLSNG